MKEMAKRLVLHGLVFLIAYTLISIFFMLGSQIGPLNPQDANYYLIFGLIESALIYFAGMALAKALLHSRDANLAPLTPLTPARFFGRNLIRHLGLILPMPIAVVLLGLAGRQTALGPFENPLYGWNEGLTLTAMLLYPTLLQTAPHSKRWDWFFLLRLAARRVFQPIWQKAIYRGKIRSTAIWASIGMFYFLAFVTAQYGEAICKAVIAFVETGAPARFALYFLAPLWGIVYLHMPIAAPWESQFLTIFLAGLNLACLYFYSRLYAQTTEELDRRHTEGWLRIRGFLETFQAGRVEVEEAPQRAAIERRRRAALREAKSISTIEEAANVEPEMSDALEAPNREPDEAESFPESVSYDPSLPPLEQIERHRPAWRKERDIAGRRPRRIRQIAAVLIWMAVCFWRFGDAKASDPAFRIVVVGILLFGVPTWLSFWQSSHLKKIVFCSHQAPAKWRDMFRKMVFDRSWRAWLADALYGFSMAWAIGWPAIGLLPSVAMIWLLRIGVAASLWLHVRQFAGRSIANTVITLMWFAAVIPFGMGLLSAVIASIEWPGSKIQMQALEVLFAVDGWLLLIVMWAGLVVWRDRRRFDGQLVMDPRRIPGPVLR